MNEQNNQDETAKTVITDLEAPNAEEIKGARNVRHRMFAIVDRTSFNEEDKE